MKSGALKRFAWPSGKEGRIVRLVGSVVLMVCLLCFLVALTHINFWRLAEANRWNTHTYQVLGQIDALQLSLSEQEAHWRGFALTGDSSFLVNARKSGRNGETALQTLRSIVVNVEQQQRVSQLAVDYHQWQTRFALRPGTPLAVQVAKMGRETKERRTAMNRLEIGLMRLRNKENSLLVDRQLVQENSQRQTGLLLLVASIFAVTLAAIATYLLGMQARTVARSSAEIYSSQSQLQTILENSPIILYTIDKEERIQLFTGKSAEKLGLDAASVRGKSMTEVFGGDYLADPIRAALHGESSVSKSHYKGNTFETHRRPLWDENGEIIGMIGVAVDITEREQAEKARMESESRFQAFMDNSPMMAFIKDDIGRMIYANRPMLRRFSKDASEMIGKNDFELWPLPTARLLFEHDQQILAGETMVELEEQVPTPDGKNPTWLSFKFPLLGASGEKYLAGLSIDITERKQVEEYLRSTSTMQRAILDGTSYLIIATSADGTIQSFNRAAQEMLGYRSEDVCGVHDPTVFFDTQEIAARAREMSAEFGVPLKAGIEVLMLPARRDVKNEREWTCVRRDGSRFPMRLSVSALRDSDGRISGYIGIGYDLSESRCAERLKNEFVSVVSHELRTPLTSIRGALGLLAGGVAGELPPGARQMIDIAQKNSERLVLLINDILDIEKIESGQMRFDFKSLRLRDLLRSALDQHRAYGEALGVRLLLGGAEGQDTLEKGEKSISEAGIPDVEVMGDEGRLQQVLSNLLSNACKFTPSGGAVHLEAEVTGTSVVVRVVDEGPGVPEEFVPRLFERFAQADSSSTRKQGGTGLGLAIARAIVEKHGGHLQYIPPAAPSPNGTPDKHTPSNDTPSNGATFAFDLKLTSPLPTASVVVAEALPPVIICEDDPEIAEMLRLVVAQSGYDSHITPTLQGARELLSERKFSGMTLDLMLPDGSGLDLLAEMRSGEHEGGIDLPVIVVSAHAKEGKLQGEAFGVLDWLHKPLDAVRLRTSFSQFQLNGRGRVLHVEDDEDVRKIMAAILGDIAQVVAASSLSQARALLENEIFDLVILDVGLPDGSGLSLVPLLSAHQPPTPVILFSASEATQDQLLDIEAAFVKSRTDNEMLRDTIQSYLKRDVSVAKPQ